jgi:hypothetical protein
MNRGSVSRAAAACDLGGIRQSWSGGGWGKRRLLARCLAIAGVAYMIFASTTLLSQGMGEAANVGCDGALLCSTGNFTLLAAAHVRGTNHHDTLGADKATKHGPLIAGRHHAYITKDAG